MALSTRSLSSTIPHLGCKLHSSVAQIGITFTQVREVRCMVEMSISGPLGPRPNTQVVP